MWSVAAYAANYYVAKNGNNSNPGTEARPWLTIQRAVDAAVAGDTIQVKAGTYNERIVLRNSGNATQGFINLQNFSGDKPVLDGRGLGNGDMVFGQNVSYVKIQGFHIKGHIGAGIVFYGAGSHIEIRNNEISDQKHLRVHGHAILISAQSWPGPVYHTITDVIIDGNYIHDVSTGDQQSGTWNEALTLAFDVRKFQITNNVIDNTNFAAIDLIGKGNNWTKSGEKYPHQGIIAHNQVRNSGRRGEHSAIYIDGAKEVVIEHNRLYDNAGHGIMINSEANDFIPRRIIVRRNESWNNLSNLTPSPGNPNTKAEQIRVVHNVLYSPKSGRANVTFFHGDNVVLKNNIFLHNNVSAADYGGLQVSHHQGTSRPTLDNNDYFPPDLWKFQYRGRHFINLWLYQSGSGQDLNSISENPLFVDAKAGNFQLRAGSPVIGAGGFLTTTKSRGSGRVIELNDSLYFSDGFGIVDGDLVQIGSNSPLRVLSVDHQAHTITIDRTISWNADSNVSYPYSGKAPNMGVDRK